MNRVILTMSYDGSDFHGWQIQDNAVTVQGELKNAFFKLFQTDVPLVGCSRTDAGVHAKRFVCHADLPTQFPCDRLPLALNALLPRSVVVYSASPAPENFHARFSCLGKTYRYRIHNTRLRDPFQEKRAYFFPQKLDAESMHQQCMAYVGKHDFAAFMASGCTVKDTVRTIFSCSVTQQEDNIDFLVTGNGFLYNMVRIMVGTLIWHEMGKLVLPIPKIIASKDRTLAGITVPPQGLYLENVLYEGFTV